jgi:hypothetical protein
MLRFVSSIGVGVNIGDLLELESTFEGDDRFKKANCRADAN